MGPLVHPKMKVEEVLQRYPQTLATFVAYGFKPLANPLLRRTFAPRVTLEAVTKLHHWDEERIGRFLADLNAKAAEELACATPLEEPEEVLYDLRDPDALRALNILVSPLSVEIDNRGLEPPEPMVRILAIAQQLRPGQRLEAINTRRPFLLYPKLAELGLAHDTRELDGGDFLITVTRPEG